MSSEVSSLGQASGIASDVAIQLTLVNPENRETVGDQLTNTSTTDNDATDGSEKGNSNASNDQVPEKVTSVAKSVKNVCLVCLETLEDQSIHSSKEISDKNEQNVSSISPDQDQTLTLLDFCNLLKVNLPPGVIRSASCTFYTPLCERCIDDVIKIKSLYRQVQELEFSLVAARDLIKYKVVANDRNKHCDSSVEGEISASTGIVCAVHKIRRYIKKDVSQSSSSFGQKKRGGRRGKKVHNQISETEGTPAGALKEAISRKSSFGRVVKRPRYFMMSDEENGDTDEVEKKFDPNSQAQRPPAPSPKEINSTCSNMKIELASSNGKQAEKSDLGEVSVELVDVKDSVIDSNKSEVVEMKSNDSEIELQGNISDGNWSDGIEQVFEGEGWTKVKKTISKKPKLRCMPKRANKFLSTKCLISMRKKAKAKSVTSFQKAKLSGVKREVGQNNSINTGTDTVNDDLQKGDSNTLEEVKFETKFENVESPKIKCDKCSRTFSDMRKKERHMLKMHSGAKRDYECKGCDKKFSKLKDLTLHRRVEHPPKVPKLDATGRKLFHCNLCKVVFKNYCDLQIHHRIHTGEKPFKCTIESCKEAFISKGRYEVHVEVKHPGKAPLKCGFCPRSFFRHHRLRDHKKSHTGEKPYLCEICSKAFTQPAYLKYHQTKHKELNLAEFKCDQCDKKFASPVNLKFHKETQHQKKYRYHCETCGHGATHMSHMKLHMRRHTGERPHTCSVCHKSFTRGSQLKIHFRSHTGERPYSCTICTKGFTNSSKLRRHELTHSDNKANKRQSIVKITHISGDDQQNRPFAHSSSSLSSENTTGTSNGILIPADLVDLQVDENTAGQAAVLKLERVPSSSLTEQDFQQQLVAIQESSGVTYQIISSEDVINNEYAEFILIDGNIADFTLG